jgi:hypothetical protein
MSGTLHDIKAAGRHTTDADVWAEMAELATASGKEWKESAIVADLRWMLSQRALWDKQAADGVPAPIRSGLRKIDGCRTLAKRWNVKKDTAAAYMRAVLPPSERPGDTSSTTARQSVDSPSTPPEGSSGTIAKVSDTSPTVPGHPADESSNTRIKSPSETVYRPSSIDSRALTAREPEPVGSQDTTDSLVARWAALIGRTPNHTDQAHLDSLPGRLAELCDTERRPLWAHPEAAALDVLDWLAKAPKDPAFGDDEAGWIVRKGKAKDGAFVLVTDRKRLRDVVRWVPEWIAEDRPDRNAADRATALWQTFAAHPNAKRPRADDPPASRPDSPRWRFTDDRAAHDAIAAALNAAGGWTAWCHLPDERQPNRGAAVGAFRSRFLASLTRPAPEPA